MYWPWRHEDEEEQEEEEKEEEEVEEEDDEEEAAAAATEEEEVVHGVSSIGRKNVGACAAFSMRTREPDLHARQLPSIEFIRAEPSVPTQEACI